MFGVRGCVCGCPLQRDGTPLHAAAEAGQLLVVKALLAHHPRVHLNHTNNVVVSPYCSH